MIFSTGLNGLPSLAALTGRRDNQSEPSAPAHGHAGQHSEHYVGGSVNTAPQVYVHGLVRQGQSAEVKLALMSQMLEESFPLLGGRTLPVTTGSISAHLTPMHRHGVDPAENSVEVEAGFAASGGICLCS